MNVLVAIDDSPHSRNAIEYVKRAAWKPETEFIVASACPPIWMGPGEAIAATAIVELNQQQERYHRETAEAGARELASAGLRAEPRLLAGDPRHSIVDEARRAGASLIVVGSHGRSGIAKLLLGSVAQHVVSHAPCSVLVVRPPVE
jgi:nucleotide-binding universal stress UspA family protein